MEENGTMTRAFKCKQCGRVVDFDSFPPSMRVIYLTLESAKLCDVCGGHLTINDMTINLDDIEKRSHVGVALHSNPTPTKLVSIWKPDDINGKQEKEK